MTVKLVILALVLTVVLSVFGQRRVEKNDNIISSTSLQLDTSVIAVLPLDTAQCWVFKDCKPVDLTNEDLLQIEKLLRECIDNYNPLQEKQFNEIKSKYPGHKFYKEHFIIDLKKYRRQYIAVTNIAGEKEVWINCFCDKDETYWKTEIVFVFDGGNCFFNLKVNLTKGEYYELMVNGEA
jgi:hypothetical protein